MNTHSMKNILATVELPINMSLEAMTAKLTIAIGDIVFEKEETGRFDEVPAFIAKQSDMEFVLFGLPEGEDGEDFVLELSGKTPLSISEFRTKVLGFVGSFLVEKEANSRGYFDFSDELAKALCSKGLMARKISQ